MSASRDSNQPPFTPSRYPRAETVKFNGVNFHTTFWEVPENVERKGRILFVHGLCEYYKAYLKVFEDFSNGGYEVFLYEQRGAGLTSPGREKGKTTAFDVFNDLDYFVGRTLEDMKDHEVNSLFLSGDSMGAALALDYGVKGRYKDQIRGIAVVGPLFEIHPDSAPPRFLQVIYMTLMRVLPRVRMVIGTVDPNRISSDPAWVKFVVEDDIITPYKASYSQIRDFYTRGQNLLKRSYNKQFCVPVLIVHAANDKVTNPKASQIFIDQLQIKDKKIVFLEQGRHVLLMEVHDIYYETISTILEWFGDH